MYNNYCCLLPLSLCFCRFPPSDLNVLAEVCDEETIEWLRREVDLNKRTPFPDSQLRFWEAPSSPSEHDPRGTPAYVAEYIERHESSVDDVDGDTHRVHPNIAANAPRKKRGMCTDI